MKVVINKCYGGFGLSALAYQKLAQKQGRECFFFEYDFTRKRYEEANISEEYFYPMHVFSVPNPNDYKLGEVGADGTYREANERSNKISIDDCRDDRTNKYLIEVVEELGDLANNRYSHLEVVEIPDGVEFEVEEYDGSEWITEKHQTWR